MLKPFERLIAKLSLGGVTPSQSAIADGARRLLQTAEKEGRWKGQTQVKDLSDKQAIEEAHKLSS